MVPLVIKRPIQYVNTRVIPRTPTWVWVETRTSYGNCMSSLPPTGGVFPGDGTLVEEDSITAETARYKTGLIVSYYAHYLGYHVMK